MGQGRFVNQKLGKRRGFAERRAKEPVAARRAAKAPRVAKEHRAIIKAGSN
jgi:hypothetical protein